MKLSVGITEISPGWEIVLNQIGVPYFQIDSQDAAAAGQLPVAIVNSTYVPNSNFNITNYLENGGAVLIDANSAKKLLDIKLRRERIDYLFSTDDDIIFSTTPYCTIGRRCSIACDSQHLSNQSGIKTILQMQVGKGVALIIPSGLVSALTNYRMKRINFPPEGGERMPSERGSAVCKSGIRRIIQTALEFLFHQRNLPFIHLWPFPDGAKTIFGFRVDTDFGTREEVENLYDICKKNAIRASWFIETKSQAEWIDYYRKMEGQEIGYHCYRHRVFPNYRANSADFQKGLAILKSAQIEAKGYAAPYGEWHPILDEVIREYGFRYSSEFAINYDDLPFYPFASDSFSSVLQIPIHPISASRLHWARHTEKQKRQYYLRVMDEKLALQEPVFLYHHPGQRRLKLFDTIFQEVKTRKIPNLTLGEYADWWQKRSAIDWQAEFIDGSVKISSDVNDDSIWLRISLPSGKVMLNRLAQKTGLLKNAIEIPKPKLIKHYDPAKLAKVTKQMLMHDFSWFYGRSKQ